MYFLEILLQLSFFPQRLHLFLLSLLSLSGAPLDFAAIPACRKLECWGVPPWKQGRVGEWNLLCSVIFVVKLVCSDQQHRQKQFPRKPKHSAISRQLVKNPEETGVAGRGVAPEPLPHRTMTECGSLARSWRWYSPAFPAGGRRKESSLNKQM